MLEILSHRIRQDKTFKRTLQYGAANGFKHHRLARIAVSLRVRGVETGVKQENMLPLAARTFVQSYFWSGHFNNASRVQLLLSPVERPDADSNLAENKSKLDYMYVVKLRNIYPTLTLSSMVQKALHVFHFIHNSIIVIMSCHCPPPQVLWVRRAYPGLSLQILQYWCTRVTTDTAGTQTVLIIEIEMN